MGIPLLWSFGNTPLIRVCVVTVHISWYITLVSSNLVLRNIVLGSIVFGSILRKGFWSVMILFPHMLVTSLSFHLVVRVFSSYLLVRISSSLM